MISQTFTHIESFYYIFQYAVRCTQFQTFRIDAISPKKALFNVVHLTNIFRQNIYSLRSELPYGGFKNIIINCADRMLPFQQCATPRFPTIVNTLVCVSVPPRSAWRTCPCWARTSRSRTSCTSTGARSSRTSPSGPRCRSRRSSCDFAQNKYLGKVLYFLLACFECAFVCFIKLYCIRYTVQHREIDGRDLPPPRSAVHIASPPKIVSLQDSPFPLNSTNLHMCFFTPCAMHKRFFQVPLPPDPSMIHATYRPTHPKKAQNFAVSNCTNEEIALYPAAAEFVPPLNKKGRTGKRKPMRVFETFIFANSIRVFS